MIGLAKKFNLKVFFSAPTLVLLTLVPVLFLQAASLVPCDGVGPGASFGPPAPGTDKCDFYQLVVLFNNILGWFVKISVPVATILIVYGGLMMIISPTDSGKRDQAKKIFWTAIWGMVAILAAYLIIDTILSELTGDSVKTKIRGISLKEQIIYRS